MMTIGSNRNSNDIRNKETDSLLHLNNSFPKDPPTFRGLFFYRSLYFLNGLSGSAWGRFGIIFYNRIAKLTPVQIGIIEGISPFLTFVAMPLWGMAADSIRSRKRVFLLCKGFNTFFLLAMGVIIMSSNGGGKDSFITVLVCSMGMSIFSAQAILESYVLEYLGEEHRDIYGTVKLWGSLSWGIGAVVMGWITDTYGFQWNFYIFAAMMLTMLGSITFGLPDRLQSEKEQYKKTMIINDGITTTTNIQQSRITTTTLLQITLCHDSAVLLWLFQVIVLGIGVALVDTYLFIYLQNDLNASTKLCGMTVGVTVVFEIPIFHYSKWLLSNVGHDVLFVIAMISYLIRVLGYTLLTETTLYWILPLEILHGFTFASMWIASIDFSAAIAPTECSTTIQTILWVSYTYIGKIIGSTVGGWIIQNYSMIIMYRGMSFIVLIVLLLHLYVWLVLERGHHAYYLDAIAKRQSAEQVEKRTMATHNNISLRAQH